MLTRYRRSPDTLCLSIRALRLSGEEAPANSGLFCLLRLPGEIIWAGAVYRGKLGLRGSDVWPPSLGSLQCSDTPGRTAIVTCIVAQNFLWLLLRKDRIWMFGSATRVTFLKWCFAACWERRGWVGFELVPDLYYSFFQNPNGSGLGVLSHTHLRPSWSLHWLSTLQYSRHFYMHPLTLALPLYELGKAHIIINTIYRWQILQLDGIMHLLIACPWFHMWEKQDLENLVSWPGSHS